MADEAVSGLSFPTAITQDHEVVGVSDHGRLLAVRVEARSDLGLQPVQGDVGEKGRDDPALWGARCRGAPPAVAYDAGLEPLPDQPLVRRDGPQLANEVVVVDVVEATADVRVQDVLRLRRDGVGERGPGPPARGPFVADAEARHPERRALPVAADLHDPAGGAPGGRTESEDPLARGALRRLLPDWDWIVTCIWGLMILSDRRLMCIE